MILVYGDKAAPTNVEMRRRSNWIGLPSDELPAALDRKGPVFEKILYTCVESRSPDDVLDGAPDPFMAAALAQAVGGKPKEKIEDLD
jgi:hypothetical protein